MNRDYRACLIGCPEQLSSRLAALYTPHHPCAPAQRPAAGHYGELIVSLR